MRTFLTLLCSIIIVIFSFAQPNPSLLDIEADVRYLASEALAGRETGTEGEKLAATYVANSFAEIGLLPGLEGSFLQSFEVDYPFASVAEEGKTFTGTNVIGFIDNKAQQTVIIAAHHDHLGIGAFGTAWEGAPTTHYGADDNASGVAALLYLGKLLQTSNLTNQNYLLISLSAQEMELQGSRYFVENPTLPLDQVKCMLNLEMVGRLDEQNTLLVNGINSSPDWEKLIDAVDAEALNVQPVDIPADAFNHGTFYDADIPAIQLFTGPHEDYHLPSDQAEKINFKGIQEIGDWTFRLLEKLNNTEAVTLNKRPEPQYPAGGARPGFKVTLGVMPDYGFQGPGLKIISVIEGRTGQKYGLMDGDIVVKMGTFDIENIFGYMEVLGKFKPGDQIKVVVQRGEALIEKEVTFE